MSALLFILTVEIVAIKLKENRHKGMMVKIGDNSKELKLCKYADDMCLLKI